MKTEIIEIDLEKPNLKILRNVAKIIRNGGLVVYPTETCYGLGANALNARAVKKVYAVKNRPFSSPLTALVSSIKMAKRYGYVDRQAERLIRKFMPGPLTIVVKKRSVLPNIFDPNEFAFRIPDNKVALKLIEYARVPIVATSANIHRNPQIYCASELIAIFDKKVDIILNAGDLKGIKPSTIVGLTRELPEIRREGPISGRKVLEELEKLD